MPDRPPGEEPEATGTEQPGTPAKWSRRFQTGLVILALAIMLFSMPFVFGLLSWESLGDGPLWRETLPHHLPQASFILIDGLAFLFVSFTILAGRRGFRGLLSRAGLLGGSLGVAFSVVLLANLNWDTTALQATFAVDGEPLLVKFITLLATLLFSLGIVCVSLSRQPQSFGRTLRRAMLGTLLATTLIFGFLFEVTVYASASQPETVHIALNSAFGLAVVSYWLLCIAEVLRGDYLALRYYDRSLRGRLRTSLFAALHAGLLLTGILIGFSLAIGGRDLLTLPGSVEVYDRSGQLLWCSGVEPEGGGRRLKTPLHRIPDSLVNAVVAIEDHTFFTPYHRPVDPVRLASSVLGSAEQLNSQGSITRLEGGSTITQQVIKMHTGRVISSNVARISPALPRVIGRPLYTVSVLLDKMVVEMPAACVLEALWSKEEILHYYLNAVYLGDGAHGVEMASRAYFGKSVDQLTDGEASLLAGLPQAPSQLNPRLDMPAARARQALVLRAMVRDGYIDQQQMDGIQADLPTLTPRNSLQIADAPHFAQVVQDQLPRLLGNRAREGVKVVSSLDSTTQQMAEQAVKDGVAAFASRGANNGALIALELRTAQVKAMVGSAKAWSDPDDGQYNMALAERPAASTFKLFVYVAAYEHGYTPDSIIDDRQRTIAGQYIANWDGADRGPVSLREAFADSRNPPAVDLTETLGVKTVAEVAHRMGITSNLHEDELGAIIGLGACSVRPLDLATAYLAVANGGIKNDPVFILSAQDWRGKTIYEHHPREGRRVISQEVAMAVDSSLSLLAQEDGFGAGTGAKTGTTDGFTDAWCAGYCPELALVTWMGNTGPEQGLRPMDNVWGYDGAGTIWRSFMSSVQANHPSQS